MFLLRKYYKWLNEQLLPYQSVVVGLLFLNIAVTMYILVFGDPVKRTAWLAYVLSP